MRIHYEKEFHDKKYKNENEFRLDYNFIEFLLNSLIDKTLIVNYRSGQQFTIPMRNIYDIKFDYDTVTITCNDGESKSMKYPSFMFKDTQDFLDDYVPLKEYIE